MLPPPVDLTQSRVDPGQPAFADMLKDLQANILKAHGRNYAHHLFIQFNPERITEARAWISGFAEQRLTSALKLEEGRLAHKATGADGGAVFTLSLSAHGYRALGFADKDLPQEVITPGLAFLQKAPGFPIGAKKTAHLLGDKIKEWDSPFRDQIDLLVLVADDNATKAAQLADEITLDVLSFGNVLLNQKGHVLLRKVNPLDGGDGTVNIEHFGYADGISQPLFFKNDIEEQASTTAWDDAASLNVILVPDPNGLTYNSFGSFLVFRKLEQNVRGFTDAEAALRSTIKDADGIVNDDLPGAMMVGRFRNGNPVILSNGNTGETRKESRITNDFDYGQDTPPPAGANVGHSSKCPFFAHTRVTNPRSDIAFKVPPSFVHAVRITRRAMPYQDVERFGEGTADLLTPTADDLRDNRPKTGVGLLFMCYQSHIGNQFEFIQNNWANHGHIDGRNIGQDGVIGQNSARPTGLDVKPLNPDIVARKLPTQWGQSVDSQCPTVMFGGYVRNKGGEYFFTPSISFLRNLGVN